MQDILVSYSPGNVLGAGHYYETLPPFAELLRDLEIDPDTVPADLEQRYTHVQTTQPARYPCLTVITLGALKIDVFCHPDKQTGLCPLSK